MNRGGSCGGGQSSLGYLFGGGETPKPAATAENAAPVQKRSPSPPVDNSKQIPAGIQNTSNNYFRADGQNTGNFITTKTQGYTQLQSKANTADFDADRPSTKVHSAPGGGSSLGYLFGGGGN